MSNEISAILKSPTMFAMKILNFTPTKYQAEILEDDNDKIMIIGSRQIGKSTVLSIKAIWTAFVKPAQEILIIAPTFRQSQIVFEKIKNFCNYNEFIKRHTIKMTMTEIKFDNNSVIRCLPAGNEGMFVRGYTATMVIFDEASLIPDNVFVAIQPSLAVKGTTLILSGTPYGRRGFFWQIYHDEILIPQKEYKKKHFAWSLHIVRAEDSPLIDKTFLEEMRRLMTVEQFEQEFEAEFIDELGLLYPYKLVESVAEDYEYAIPTQRPHDNIKYYMGIDVARSGNDETAIVIVEYDEVQETYKVMWAETMHQEDLVNVVGRIVSLYKSTIIDGAFIDSTGLGAGVYDMLARHLGDGIKDVTFTTGTRKNIYNHLKILMQQKKLKLNRANRKFLSQFSNFSVKYSVDGREIITKGENGNDDLVDALALACYTGAVQRVEVLEEILQYVDKKPIMKVNEGESDIYKLGGEREW